jgi:hypothetical protein
LFHQGHVSSTVEIKQEFRPPEYEKVVFPVAGCRAAARQAAASTVKPGSVLQPDHDPAV